MLEMRKRRGQVFTTDYIIGVAIFIILFALCIFAWQKTVYMVQKDFLIDDMMYTAKRASEQLLMSPGVPVNWEDDLSSTKAVGLATGNRVLSGEKFTRLSEMDYDTLKYYLGAGNYDIYIRIENSTGSIIGEINKRPQGEIVVNVRRIAVMDNQSVILDLSVWGSDLLTTGAPVFPAQ